MPAKGPKTHSQTKSRGRSSNRWVLKMISDSSKIFTGVQIHFFKAFFLDSASPYLVLLNQHHVLLKASQYIQTVTPPHHPPRQKKPCVKINAVLDQPPS